MSLPLTRDGWLLFTTCGVRSFAYGFLSVILGLYLDSIGLSTIAIGWIFTAALAGGAAMTIVITAVADSFGRRALLILGALLMALAGCIFAVSDNPVLLVCAAIFGTISPSGKEVGPFLSLEQAILPQTTQDQHRTAVFSAYNLVGSFAGAVGALAVGLPSLFSLSVLAGYRFLVWAYVASAIGLMVLFAMLSPSIEAQVQTDATTRKIGVRKSRGIVAKLAGLFALDAFAGGFIVQSIVAYWFYLRYQTDLNALGGIFFGTNLLAALSFLAAPAIARRFGLLMGSGGAAPAPSALAVGRADAPVVHDGGRRSRRARRVGRHPLRRAQRRRRPCAAFHWRSASDSVPGLAVFVIRGVEGRLRYLDLRGVSESEAAGGERLMKSVLLKPTA
jgi:MFS family permease